jgi:Ca-activated chloride channel family protein
VIENPAGLWYLFLLVPIVFLLWLRYRGGRRDLLGLVGKWRAAEAADVFVVKWFFSGLSLLLFTIFAVLAIAGISWGKYPVSTNYAGTDVSIAVDVSRSMLAQDLFPSRIKRVAGVLREVISANTGIRFDIVVFKGTAVEVLPATQVTEALTSIAEVLGPTMLTSPGTNIERGIQTAMTAFAPQDPNRRIILLFTDGGSLTGDALKAARRAAVLHIPIYVAAVGTAAGAPIPIGNGRFVEDASGNRIITKLDLPPIETIARVSGGKVLMLSDPLIARKIDSIIGPRSAMGSVASYRFEIKKQYRVFVVSALLSLCVFLAVRIIRWKEIL